MNAVLVCSLLKCIDELLDRAMEYIRDVFHQIKQLNWYKNSTANGEESSETKNQQVLSTRIYIILLAAALTILVVLLSLSTTTITMTELKPSINTYKMLAAKYPDTLSCPCEHISVTYDRFVSFIPTYHPVSKIEVAHTTMLVKY
jgi:hypothetical protein